MTEHFHIPGAWDPASSALGRIVGHLERDRLRAEATFYVLAVSAVFGYMVLVFVGWAWINWDGTPVKAQADQYWLLQAVGFLSVVLLVWAGRRGSTEVLLEEEAIRIRPSRGSDVVIRYEDIQEATRVSRERYHQHYRRYAQTRIFVGKNPPLLLALRTSTYPVFLGIRPEEQALFMECVATHLERRSRSETRVA